MVELHSAYVWDCPDCGRENFQRAVTFYLDPKDEADAEALRELYGEDVDEIPEGHIPTAESYPNRVTCKHCEKEFETAPLFSGDDDDLEDE